ncbi:MAG TPA: nuclear transport factor 2 family protein [Vicinamibacterales bacterium]|nr:nuclear transport factor 2 family protein [Vicinamibacterales bacterium]
MMRTLTAIVFGAVLAVTPASAQTPAAMQALAARVETLEAQEAIRQLWADYGRTLDARDFAAFSTLWAREATYGGTPAAPGAKGPAAIGAFLEKAIGTNYPDSKGKNFHLYFNESIDVQGDRATAVSKGGFVMASADNGKADFLLLATYRDELIKEDGKWKFLRREISGDIPVPRARR